MTLTSDSKSTGDVLPFSYSGLGAPKLGNNFNFEGFDPHAVRVFEMEHDRITQLTRAAGITPDAMYGNVVSAIRIMKVMALAQSATRSLSNKGRNAVVTIGTGFTAFIGVGIATTADVAFIPLGVGAVLAGAQLPGYFRGIAHKTYQASNLTLEHREYVKKESDVTKLVPEFLALKAFGDDDNSVGALRALISDVDVKATASDQPYASEVWTVAERNEGKEARKMYGRASMRKRAGKPSREVFDHLRAYGIATRCAERVSVAVVDNTRDTVNRLAEDAEERPAAQLLHSSALLTRAVVSLRILELQAAIRQVTPMDEVFSVRRQPRVGQGMGYGMHSLPGARDIDFPVRSIDFVAGAFTFE